MYQWGIWMNASWTKLVSKLSFGLYPKRDCLWLYSGNRLKGQVTHASKKGLRLLLGDSGHDVLVSHHDICQRFLVNDKRDQFYRKLQDIEAQDTVKQTKLARWAMNCKLYDESHHLLLLARAHAPDHPMVIHALTDLQEMREADTPQDDPDPAGPSVVMKMSA